MSGSLIAKGSSSVLGTTGSIAAERDFILSRIAPSRIQTRLALATVLMLLCVTAIVLGPLSDVHPPRIDAFVPAYLAAIFVTDFITAVILYAQFSILRSRALLVLASGYLFTALISIAYLIAFPQLFHLPSVIGGDVQLSLSIYMFWHTGFPAFVIGYAFISRVDDARTPRHSAVSPAIFWSAAATGALVVCGIAFLWYIGDALLPHLNVNLISSNRTVLEGAGYLVIVVCLVAVGTLWVPPRSLLDLWLMVVMCAYMTEIFLILGPDSARFSLEWYVGRVFTLLSASLVLCVLLYEITVLYGRAVLAQRREREARLLTGDAIAASVAHEVKQPLTSIIFNAQSGVRWLDREEPNLREATTALNAIVATSHRVATLVESIRAVFGQGALSKTSFSIDDLVREVLGLLKRELEENRVAVYVELARDTPQFTADRVRLLQVLFNLMRNAIESMAATDGPRRLEIGALQDGGELLFSVGDTGAGIDELDDHRLFNPLFTTKPGGMGMGLSICRSIVEAHHGRIWVVRRDPHGAVFYFTIKQADGNGDEPARPDDA